MTCNPPDAADPEVTLDDPRVTEVAFSGLTPGKEYEFGILANYKKLEGEKRTIKATTSKGCFIFQTVYLFCLVSDFKFVVLELSLLHCIEIHLHFTLSNFHSKVCFDRSNNFYIQCVPEKRKSINQVNFSENCNDLSEKVYIVIKFSLSSFC